MGITASAVDVPAVSPGVRTTSDPDATNRKALLQAVDVDELAKQNVTHDPSALSDIAGGLPADQKAVTMGYDSSNPDNQLISKLIQTQFAPSPYPWGHISWDPDGSLNYLGCSAPPISAALARGLETGDVQAFSEAAAADAGCWLNVADVDDFMVAQPWLKGVEQAHVVTNPNSLRPATLSVR
jgi:peptide/nickel transport system substrate-binding protein